MPEIATATHEKIELSILSFLTLNIFFPNSDIKYPHAFGIYGGFDAALPKHWGVV